MVVWFSYGLCLGADHAGSPTGEFSCWPFRAISDLTGHSLLILPKYARQLSPGPGTSRSRSDAVATIYRGQIWDPLQPLLAVTRSHDSLLTHPRSSSLRTIRLLASCQPTIDLQNTNYTNSNLPSLVVTAWPSSFSRQQHFLASPQHPGTHGTFGSAQNASKQLLASSAPGSAALPAHTR